MLAILVSLICIGGLFCLKFAETQGYVGILRGNWYGLLSLIPFVLCLGLLLLMATRTARTDERIWLCVYIAGVCLWASGEMLERFSLLPASALFWTTFSAIGVAILPASMYLFALAYTDQSGRRYPGVTTVLLVTSFIIAFFYSFTSLVFNLDPGAMKMYPWGFNNDPGPGLGFTLSWLDFIFILALMRLIHFRRRTRNVILRKQSLIFIVAVAIPLVGGTLTDGILPILGVNTLPPAAMLLSSVTSILLAYGVLRYKMLTINPSLFSETILSLMHEAVVVTDNGFRVLYMNPEAQTLLGVMNEERRQLRLHEFIRTPAMLQQFKAALAQARPHGETVTLEHIDIYRSASVKTPVRVTSSPFKTEAFEAHVLVLSDISAELHSKSIIEHTVQVRTEELHQARAYLVASINSLGQGFMLVNRQADVALTNGAAARLLERIGGDAAKQHLTDAAGAALWDIDLPGAVQRVLELRRPKQLHAASRDGSFYTVYITPVLSDGEVLGAAVVIEDVTEQRILERSKEEFFSIASHELRTPLTAIRGNMDMMMDEHKAELQKINPKLYEMADDVHTASVRLIAIVNDFLDSTRLEQGKMKFTLEPTSVKQAVKAVLPGLKQLAAGQQTSVTLSGLDELPLVKADPERLKQIFYNIIHNAVKFTVEGSVRITAETKGRTVRVLVSDTGQGIAPKNQKLLFHKFQQAGDSILTRDTTQGTGLGLYISRLLASHMHGDVALERSAAGKGSTFVITLPQARKR
jgi:signal transduction histidine kinase